MNFNHRVQELMAQLPQCLGARINAHLQVAFDVAMVRDVQMGIPVQDTEMADGLINGFCNLLVKAFNNRARLHGPVAATALCDRISNDIATTWAKDGHHYLSRCERGETISFNPETIGRG